MLREFKNLELLRFHITRGIDKCINKMSEENNKNSDIITSSIFSMGSSFVVGFIIEKYIVTDIDWIKIVVLLVGFLLSYFAFLFLYTIIGKKISNFIFYFKIHKENDRNSINNIINDFDHIACDNMLISYEFIENYNKVTDENLKTFYYYEIMYYLKISIDKTYAILLDKDNCINSGTKCDAIDIYRIQNVYNMMTNIYKFIDDNQGKNIVNQDYNNDLKANINNLKNGIDEIGKSL